MIYLVLEIGQDRKLASIRRELYSQAKNPNLSSTRLDLCVEIVTAAAIAHTLPDILAVLVWNDVRLIRRDGRVARLLTLSDGIKILNRGAWRSVPRICDFTELVFHHIFVKADCLLQFLVVLFRFGSSKREPFAFKFVEQ